MTAITQPLLTRRNMAMAAAAMLALPASRARAEDDSHELVRRARTTMETARTDPQFGAAPEYFKRARAIMVVPQLVKGGFFIGGEGGNGVLMQPSVDGWNKPLFYTLAAASFGLQIGLEVAEVVMFVMSDKALRAWTTDEVKLGAQAGLTVLIVGSNAAAAATTNGNVDVIAWAKSKGAYAGVTLEGSIIKPRTEYNTQYYGHPVVPEKMMRLG